MPGALRGRAADNWRRFLAIADAAGETWGKRARKAAQGLAGVARSRLQASCSWKTSAPCSPIEVPTGSRRAEIIEALVGLENRPWPEWKGDKPITTRQLAKLLEPFAVSPTTIWTDGRSFKGYHLGSFADAFARYLGPMP